MYEDEEFDQRQLAALVASKVFFHLGELNDALSYALGAGALFDVADDSDYAQTLLGEGSHLHYDRFLIATVESILITLPLFLALFLSSAKALDEYAAIQSRAAGEEKTMDPRLEAIVERMLDKYDSALMICCFSVSKKHSSELTSTLLPFRCILDGKYQQAMGMAVDCRRLDKLEGAISRCDNLHGALSYCINLSHQYVSHREYRLEVRACYKSCQTFQLLVIGTEELLLT